MIELEITLRKICEFYGIDYEQTKGKSRDQIFVRARFMYFYMVKTRYKNKYSLKEIGYLVNRDHASVIHGIKTIKQDIEENYKGALSDYQAINERVNTTNFKAIIRESKLKIKHHEEQIQKEKNFVKSL